jgi:hypothetical protein
VGAARETRGLNLDEVAGAHPKSAPNCVLLAESCQARLTKTDEEMNTKIAISLSQFDKNCTRQNNKGQHLCWPEKLFSNQYSALLGPHRWV